MARRPDPDARWAALWIILYCVVIAYTILGVLVAGELAGWWSL